MPLLFLYGTAGSRAAETPLWLQMRARHAVPYMCMQCCVCTGALGVIGRHVHAVQCYVCASVFGYKAGWCERVPCYSAASQLFLEQCATWHMMPAISQVNVWGALPAWGGRLCQLVESLCGCGTA